MSSRAKVISFISASGGVGKTTLSIILAAWLAKYRKVSSYNILLVDMDPTAGLSLALMDNKAYDTIVDSKMTLADMYFDRFKHRKNVKADDYVSPAKVGDVHLRILVPGEDFIDAVDDAWKAGNPGSIFRRLFEKAGVYSGFDYIIIDSAPFFDLRYTVLSIYLSSKYAVVLRPALIDCKRTLRMLHKLEQYYAEEMGGVREFYSRFLGILNMVPPNMKEFKLLRALGYKDPKDRGSSDRWKRDEVMASLEDLLKEIGDRIKMVEYFITRQADVMRLDVGSKGFWDVVKPAIEEIAGYMDQ